MADVVHAFMESPQWKRGALFIVYDEWGGFFDHVRPPRVPDDRTSRDLNKDFGQMGFRIPAVAVSPYVRRGHVDHTIYGFESILKMIQLPLRARPADHAATPTRTTSRASFDFESKPRLDLPDLPDPAHVMSHACAVPGLALPNPGTAPQAQLPPVPLTRAQPHALTRDAHQRLPRAARLQVPPRHRCNHLPPAVGNHLEVALVLRRAGVAAALAAGPQPDGPRLGRAGHAHGRRPVRRGSRRALPADHRGGSGRRRASTSAPLRCGSGSGWPASAAAPSTPRRAPP